jgi:two-component system OmpR family response regulator
MVPSEADDGRGTILICEDEPELRELIRVVLNGGYAFVEAADGVESLELARGLRPDLVLLDLMMPGQSGVEVLRELRSDPALEQTPVIVVSAFSTDADKASAFAAGADRFLEKPFEPDELAAMVEELLGRGG